MAGSGRLSLREGMVACSYGGMFFRLTLFLVAYMTAAAAPPAQIRVATYNASLNRSSAGQLFTDLSAPASAGAAQVKRIAEIIQRNAPDLLLVNEFDYDPQTDGLG